MQARRRAGVERAREGQCEMDFLTGKWPMALIFAVVLAFLIAVVFWG
jgi:hypothetical protein